MAVESSFTRTFAALEPYFSESSLHFGGDQLEEGKVTFDLRSRTDTSALAGTTPVIFSTNAVLGNFHRHTGSRYVVPLGEQYAHVASLWPFA